MNRKAGKRLHDLQSEWIQHLWRADSNVSFIRPPPLFGSKQASGPAWGVCFMGMVLLPSELWLPHTKQACQSLPTSLLQVWHEGSLQGPSRPSFPGSPSPLRDGSLSPSGCANNPLFSLSPLPNHLSHLSKIPELHLRCHLNRRWATELPRNIFIEEGAKKERSQHPIQHILFYPYLDICL